MTPVCGKCGDRGYEETLICCFMCQDAYEHRYCFNKASDIFKIDVKFACEDCLPTIRARKPFPKKIWRLPSRRSERLSTRSSPSSKASFEAKPAGKISPPSAKRTKQKSESSPCALANSNGSAECNEKDGEMSPPSPKNKQESESSPVLTNSEGSAECNEKDGERSPASAKRTKQESESSPALTNSKGSAECNEKDGEISPPSAKRTKQKSESSLALTNSKGSAECNEKNGEKDVQVPSETEEKPPELIKESLSNPEEAKSYSGGSLWIDLPGSSPLNDTTSLGMQENCNVHAQPIKDPIWKGSLRISYKKLSIVEGVAAHLSTLACPKAQQEASLLPVALCPRIVPRSSVWPKSFQKAEPKDESIGLYFFPEGDRDSEAFDSLVNHMITDDLAMVCVVKNAELLVFTSMKLPFDYWRFQGKRYLWGVFRAKQTHP